MSHAQGEVWRLNDPLVYLFEYNGTSDVVRPAIFTTENDLMDHWRDEDGGWLRARGCQHLARANRIAPITHGQTIPEDQAAVNAYLRHALDRAGILHK